MFLSASAHTSRRLARALAVTVVAALLPVATASSASAESCVPGIYPYEDDLVDGSWVFTGVGPVTSLTYTWDVYGSNLGFALRLDDATANPTPEYQGAGGEDWPEWLGADNYAGQSDDADGCAVSHDFSLPMGLNETGQARAFTIVFGDTGYTLKVVQLPRPAAAAAAPAVAAGAQATVTGVGFMPGESVTGTMHSDPLDLGVQVADDNGEVTFTWTIPAGTAAGTHTVELTGDETGTVTTTLDVQGDSLASIMEVIRQLLQRLLDFITQFLAGLGLNR